MTDPRRALREILDADATTVSDSADRDDLREGGTWLLDLVAAVDHLARGQRHDFTVWDALEEAIRWWTAEQLSAVKGAADSGLADPPWGAPDPLHTTMQQLLDIAADGEPAAVTAAMQQAVRRWSQTMASLYNDGQEWPHPMPRRAFPPPLLPFADEPS